MSKYANDEFDRVPEFTDRNGVHRAETAGTAKRPGLGLLMGVGVLALLVGLFSFFVLPQMTGTPTASPGDSAGAPAASSDAANTSDAESEPAESETAESETAESEPVESEAPESESEEPEASPEPEESDEPEESSEAAGAVDRSAPIGVYNGAGRSGLAGSVASSLRNGGFTSISAANWSRQENVSVVYFRSESSRSTAQEAARVLGIATVFQTPNIPTEISVVLGRDYS